MFFVKYGKKKHLEEIIKGYIRFSPISLYREIEQDTYENGMADPHDGMARNLTKKLNFKTINGEELNFQGNIVINIDIEGMEKLAVFCLSVYNDVLEMNEHYKYMLKMFPETTHVLIIHSPNRFAKDLQEVLPNVAGGTVRYGEKMQPPKHEDNMWRQALYKRPQYEYQKEFRFVINKSNFDVPFRYKYDNNSKMTLLETNEIESFINDNLNKDIEIKKPEDEVLELENKTTELDYEVTEISIEEY